MSRVEHVTVEYVCNGCGAYKAVPPGNTVLPEGWALMVFADPVGDEEHEIHVCPTCWARGFRFHGAAFVEAEEEA